VASGQRYSPDGLTSKYSTPGSVTVIPDGALRVSFLTNIARILDEAYECTFEDAFHAVEALSREPARNESLGLKEPSRRAVSSSDILPEISEG
jgi:hypothetical protein